MDPASASSPLGPVTSTTLLKGLEDPANQTVWQQYVGRYRPLIVRYAKKLDVPAEEAEDIAQATLLAFSKSYRAGKYERAKGRLSSWLFGIAKNEIRSSDRARRGRLAAGSTEAEEGIAALAAEDELEELWEREWRDAVFWECLKLVRSEVKPETMRAFERFALDERPAGEVAAELGLTQNAVFGAKRRVLGRIRELLPLVEDAW